MNSHKKVSYQRLVAIIQNLKYDKDLLIDQRKVLSIGLLKRIEISSKIKNIDRKIAIYEEKLRRFPKTDQQCVAGIKMQDLKVFLSYASEDRKKVRKLYEMLSDMGITPWFDKESLLPGQIWKTQIYQAVKESDAVLVCLSQNSITKRGFVQAELRYILDAANEIPEGQIYVIPVKLEKCNMPLSLQKFHAVNLYTSTGFSKLSQSLEICSKTS